MMRFQFTVHTVNYDQLIWMILEDQQLMNEVKSTDLVRDLQAQWHIVVPLKEIQFGFLCGFKIAFDQFSNQGSFLKTHVHDIFIGTTATQVPTHFETICFDIFRLLFHAINHG